MLLVDISRNLFYVLRFISISDLFTNSPSYNTHGGFAKSIKKFNWRILHKDIPLENWLPGDSIIMTDLKKIWLNLPAIM
jgi:hypothetical protein